MSAFKRQRLTEEASGFISFGQDDEPSDEEKAHEEPAPDAAQTGCSAAVAQPLALDWSCSDLLLTETPCAGRGTLVSASTPDVWALGRAMHPAYQGRHRWRLRVLRLFVMVDVTVLFFCLEVN